MKRDRNGNELVQKVVSHEEKSDQPAHEILRERAIALSRPLDKKVVKREKIVIFSLEDEWYGLFAYQVKEILKPGKITIVPGAPVHIKGITNLRGEITSVTDPKRLLGLNETPFTEKSGLIVVETAEITTALLVDSVADIQDVSLDEIEPPLVTLDRLQQEYLKGEVRADGKLLAILNLEKLLKEA